MVNRASRSFQNGDNTILHKEVKKSKSFRSARFLYSVNGHNVEFKTVILRRSQDI